MCKPRVIKKIKLTNFKEIEDLQLDYLNQIIYLVSKMMIII